MASAKTTLTELATAVGLVYEPTRAGPLDLDELDVPGIDAPVWQAAVLPATRVGSADRDLLLSALDNGRTFRTNVLGGRRPSHVEWLGAAKSVWTSDIPRDLVVDGVWFIQTKYDSTCILNTSPGSLVDDLLVDHSIDARQSWFEEVALAQLQALYTVVRRHLDDPDLPDDVRDVDAETKATLKSAMRSSPASEAEDRAYAELCRAVSLETTLRWRHRLDASTKAQRSQMFCRMLRIAGGPYWLLGVKRHEAVRLRVMDTRTWRERFDLRRFQVTDAHAGQPQVDWRATIADRTSGETHVVEGACELRWSHGRLQGNPECKIQVSTPLDRVPGYEPLDGRAVTTRPSPSPRRLDRP
jgi:hypothetical protein